MSATRISRLDRLFDIYELKADFERFNGLIDVAAASADLGFLRHARRALLPLPLIDRRPPAPGPVLPPLRSRPLGALRGKRVAVVVSGGAGGCVALVGAARAFEEAGIEPVFLSACSGGVLWSAMWAAGLDAAAMAEFSLSWAPEDYVDMQWRKLPRFAIGALRGFSGLLKGEAVERLFNDRFGGLPIGETAFPLSTIVYDMDRGVVDYFGSQRTPRMSIGHLVRIGIALPLCVEAVEYEGHKYVDGGIIDLLPLEPILADLDRFDHVIALNSMLPPQAEPEDITGWADEPMGILRASRQLQQGYHVEFARRARAQLGDRLTIADICDHRLLRGVSFYDLFIDRSHWPELIREGHKRTHAALDRLRVHRRRPATSRQA